MFITHEWLVGEEYMKHTKILLVVAKDTIAQAIAVDKYKEIVNRYKPLHMAPPWSQLIIQT